MAAFPPAARWIAWLLEGLLADPQLLDPQQLAAAIEACARRREPRIFLGVQGRPGEISGASGGRLTGH